MRAVRLANPKSITISAYCPNGPGGEPFEGVRSGGTGNDQWAPYSGDGQNAWVQTGTWVSSDPGNRCMTHHSINSGAHGRPGWGTNGQWVADAGYLDWILW